MEGEINESKKQQIEITLKIEEIEELERMAKEAGLNIDELSQAILNNKCRESQQ